MLGARVAAGRRCVCVCVRLGACAQHAAGQGAAALCAWALAPLQGALGSSRAGAAAGCCCFVRLGAGAAAEELGSLGAGAAAWELLSWGLGAGAAAGLVPLCALGRLGARAQGAAVCAWELGCWWLAPLQPLTYFFGPTRFRLLSGNYAAVQELQCC